MQPRTLQRIDTWGPMDDSRGRGVQSYIDRTYANRVEYDRTALKRKKWDMGAARKHALQSPEEDAPSK